MIRRADGRAILARRDRRARVACVLALASVAGCGGGTSTNPLAWKYGFTSGVVATRAVGITATVRQGSCTGPVHWSEDLSATGTASGMAPPTLPPGPWAFEVQAHDASCVTFASGCTQVTLPAQSGQVVVQLLSVPNTPACGPTACRSGLCDHADGGGIVDAGAADVCVPRPEVCNGLDDDCDGVIDNGFDLTSDPTHCGNCTTSCALPNATGVCLAGVCTGDVGTCAAGFADCDGDPSDGCETPTNTLTDCGGCGMPCSVPNGTATCATGTCAVQSCNAGYGNCDGSAVTGCETMTNTIDHCGACATVCSYPHATAMCTAAGTCAMGACDAGYADCNRLPTDGCEIDTNTNEFNCGMCGNHCTGSAHMCCTGMCGSC